MPADERLRMEYDLHKGALNAVAAYVSSTVQAWADKQHYAFVGRIKELDSLAEKVESGRYQSWSDIDDLYACTVVIPSVTNETSALEFLSSTFVKIETKSRNSTMKEPEVFRFDQTRFYGKISPDVSSRFVPGAGDIKFEVQLPTVFEYAWMTTTHDLVYKGDSVEWGRIRLAAMMRAIIEQLDLIVQDFDGNAHLVAPSTSPSLEAERYLIKTAQDLFTSGLLAAELKPRSWRKFSENALSLLKANHIGRSSQPKALKQMADELVTYVTRNASLREFRSGTLFQVLVASIIDAHTTEAIKEFPLVNSDSYHQFLGVNSLPMIFKL